MLMKLTPGVNFINLFTRSCYTHSDPKSTKRQSSHQFLLALLGSTQVKALRKTLVKLTPGWKVKVKQLS